MKVYCLSYSYYEEYVPYLFSHENDDVDFDALCDNLLDKAVHSAMLNCTGKQFIGWHEIVQELAEHLIEYGFTRIHPIQKDYFGSTIIRDDDRDKGNLSGASFSKLQDYNKELFTRVIK